MISSGGGIIITGAGGAGGSGHGTGHNKPHLLLIKHLPLPGNVSVITFSPQSLGGGGGAGSGGLTSPGGTSSTGGGGNTISGDSLKIGSTKPSAG